MLQYHAECDMYVTHTSYNKSISSIKRQPIFSYERRIAMADKGSRVQTNGGKDPGSSYRDNKDGTIHLTHHDGWCRVWERCWW